MTITRSQTRLNETRDKRGGISNQILDFSQCSNKFDFIMYADDTTLSSTVNSFSDNNFSVDTLINEGLSKVIEWLKINKF